MIFSITTCSPLCSLEHKDTQTALLNYEFLFPSKRIKIMQYLASWQAVTVLRILCLVIEEILKALLGEMFLQDVYNIFDRFANDLILMIPVRLGRRRQEQRAKKNLPHHLAGSPMECSHIQTWLV